MKKILFSILIFGAIALNAQNNGQAFSAHTDSTSTKKYKSAVAEGWHDNDGPAEMQKITILESHIMHYKHLIGIVPENLFNYSLMLNTMAAFVKGSPYDTIVISKKWITHKIKEDIRKAKENPDSTGAEFEKKLQNTLNTGNLIKLTRREMWKKELATYKEFMPAHLYPDIEKAVYELHDSLNLSWDDSVYVFKERFENLKNRIKEEWDKKEVEETKTLEKL